MLSTDICTDTADSTAILSHLEEWSELCYCADWVRRSNCRDGRMMMVIIVISQLLFLPVCESWGETAALWLYGSVWKIITFPEPLPPAWITGMWHSAEALSGRQWGHHPNVTHQCESRCCFLGLLLWAGIVGVIFDGWLISSMYKLYDHHPYLM